MAKSSTVELDFSNVTERKQRRPRFPEGTIGQRRLKIVKIEPNEKSKAKAPMWVVTFLGLSGDVRGKQHTEYFPLAENTMWKLRDLLEAVGLKVSGKKAKFDPSKLEGKVIGAEFVDGEPFVSKTGKEFVNAEVDFYLPASDVIEPAEETSDNVPVSDDGNEDVTEEEEDEAAAADGDDGEEFDLDAI
jgi:hypothetical protein